MSDTAADNQPSTRREDFMRRPAQPDSASVFVFLRTKLGTCDAAVPLMMDLKRLVPPVDITYVVGDRATFELIRRNVVLWDGIHLTGSLLCQEASSAGRMGLLWHKIRKALWLARLALLGRKGRASFLHFGTLKNWPLRFLYLSNKRHTFQLHEDPWPFTELLARVRRLLYPHVDPKVTAAGVLVAYDETWPPLHDPEVADLPRYVIGPPHLRTTWLRFTRDHADAYIAAARGGRNVDDVFVTYILGFLGIIPGLREPNVLRELFRETLDALIESCSLPILIKPHPTTDPNVLRDEVSKRGNDRIVICDIHPQVLAWRSAFFIANYYSTTLPDAHSLGVPTIEYTDYSDEALAITHGGSREPRYVTTFINHDRELLARTVSQMSEMGCRATFPTHTFDDVEFLTRVAFHT